MSRLLDAYHRLPYGLRAAAATLRGYQLRTWRYGPESEGLIDAAIERDNWSAERWKAWREERLPRLLHRAATRVPYYAQLWSKRRQAGDRARWDQLENWPVLTKDALREAPRAFVADDRRPEQMFAVNTSGTTGKPLTLWRTRAVSRSWYALIEARMRRWHGVSREEPWAIFGGQLVVPFTQQHPPFWVYNAALRQLYFSTHHISDASVEDYAKALGTYRISHVIMYPSSVQALVALAAEKGINLPPLRVALSNAELLTPMQRDAIGRAFRCPVINTYGMVEIAAGASECSAGTMHAWPEAGIIETLRDTEDVPVDPGTSGRFIVTGLLNPDMPLIRYAVGDRGRLGSDASTCGCGRALPTVAALEGRSNDMIITPTGRHVFWLNPVFYGAPVREAQIIQESEDTLRVKLVVAPGFGPSDASAIERRLRDRVGEMRVVFEEVGVLPRTSNGKVQAVINAWAQQNRPQPSAEEDGHSRE